MKSFLNISISIVFLLIGCSSNTKKITLKSHFKGNLDSIIIHINLKTVAKVINIKNNLDTSIFYLGDTVHTPGNVGTFISLYQDGKKIDRFEDYDDLLGSKIPQTIKVEITDRSKLEVSIKR